MRREDERARPALGRQGGRHLVDGRRTEEGGRLVEEQERDWLARKAGESGGTGESGGASSSRMGGLTSKCSKRLAVASIGVASGVGDFPSSARPTGEEAAVEGVSGRRFS